MVSPTDKMVVFFDCKPSYIEAGRKSPEPIAAFIEADIKALVKSKIGSGKTTYSTSHNSNLVSHLIPLIFFTIDK
jgi:hypothetical protein